MYDLEYHRPQSIAEAVDALKADDEAKVIAGGMTLLPTMKLRMAAPSALWDLGGVAGLSSIERSGDVLTIGAMATHASVASSELVREAIPALAALAGDIGDAQVRNRGTIGGSVANNDPAADYPAAVLALAATIQTDRRRIAADDFFTGLWSTCLEEDELITAIEFPVVDRSGYAKFPNPASRYAIVGVMVAQRGDKVRVGVTGAAAVVFRAEEFEQALMTEFSQQAIMHLSVTADGLNEDIHATAEYRAALIKVMAKRAIAKAS